MAIYENLSDIVDKIFLEISNSDDLDTYLRLVGYDGKDALSGSHSLPTFNDLMWNRQYPFIKPLDPKTENGTYLMVYFRDGSFAGSNNVYQHNAPFKLEFLCHKDTWNLNDRKVRPYELLGVLYKILNNMDVEDSIRGKFVVSPPSLLISHNGQYAGYSFELSFTDDSSDC